MGGLSGLASNKLMKMPHNLTQHTDWTKVNIQLAPTQPSSVVSQQPNSPNHSHLLIHSFNGNKSLIIQSSVPMWPLSKPSMVLKPSKKSHNICVRLFKFRLSLIYFNQKIRPFNLLLGK